MTATTIATRIGLFTAAFLILINTTPAHGQYISKSGTERDYRWWFQLENYTNQNGVKATSLSASIESMYRPQGISQWFDVDQNDTNRWKSYMFIWLELDSTDAVEDMWANSTTYLTNFEMGSGTSLHYSPENDLNSVHGYLFMTPGRTQNMSHYYSEYTNPPGLSITFGASGIFHNNPVIGRQIGRDYLASIPEPTSIGTVGIALLGAFRRRR